MNGRTFSLNPRKRGKKNQRHHHLFPVATDRIVGLSLHQTLSNVFGTKHEQTGLDFTVGGVITLTTQHTVRR